MTVVLVRYGLAGFGAVVCLVSEGRRLLDPDFVLGGSRGLGFGGKLVGGKQVCKPANSQESLLVYITQTYAFVGRLQKEKLLLSIVIISHET